MRQHEISDCGLHHTSQIKLLHSSGVGPCSKLTLCVYVSDAWWMDGVSQMSIFVDFSSPSSP